MHGTYAQPVVLLGIRGCGKTSTGTILSALLHVPFVDSDREIQKRYNQTPRAIYAQEGVVAFRKKEACVVSAVFHQRIGAFVFAAGGGICDNTAAITAIPPKSLTVFIDTSESVLFARIQYTYEQGGGIPAFLSNDIDTAKRQFSRLYGQRRRQYLALADICMPADKNTAAEVAQHIFEHMQSLGEQRKN